MNVVSLFDGISGARLSLERAGIKVDNYYASEIDKYAIKVSQINYPDIIQLGSVIDIDCSKLPNIDLLIGGSPCQSFSFSGKMKGMVTKDEVEIYSLEHYLQLKNDGFKFEGQSYLFWEFVRILNESKPKYFFLENVGMEEKWEKVITKALDVHPVKINSSLLSCQFRNRLYWTNIGMKQAGLFGDLESAIEIPKDKGIVLKDVLEDNVDSKYYISQKMYDYAMVGNINGFRYRAEITDINGKARPLTTKQDKRAGVTNYIHHPTTADILIDKTEYRRLTPLECERCQTLPDNYTNYLSDTQRYKAIGNGFTIEVIAYILRYLPDQYKTN
jgi:DNA (cytosine-5)-methyltransferase 3A